jgi:hypothetical protein
MVLEVPVGDQREFESHFKVVAKLENALYVINYVTVLSLYIKGRQSSSGGKARFAIRIL